MSRIVAIICFLSALVLADDALFSSGVTAKRSSGPSVRSSVALTPTYAEVAVDSAYVLGPGDFLDIMLEENYMSVQVYPDGSVAIEECGVVNVGGKTFAEAREMILDLAAKRYKREFCFVQLAALKKFRVNAMGAVNMVGQHLVDAQTRLSFFIRQAGGFVANADADSILIFRGKDTLRVNYRKMSSEGIFENDIMLEQGDNVYVPYVSMGENIALIFPGVRTSVKYSPDRTVQDYFDIAEGGRLHNFGYKSVCIREPGKPPSWISLSEMKTTKVPPNTEIEFSVQEMLVYVGGAVNFLGRYPYDPNWHAIDYAAAAGINTITGTWRQIKVWRGTEPEALTLSVTEDPILPGDYIEVPKSHYESFKDFTLFLASLLTVISSAFIIYVNYK